MTALRPIAPLVLNGVVPKAPATGVPELTMIAPGDVLVDDRYQRGLSERSIRMIRRIVAEFDWRRWRPPVCVWGDEGLMAIDGQHSLVAAASHPLINEVPVLIVAADSLKDRAATFIGINTDRLAVTTMQMHAAAVVAGDAAAVRVQALLDQLGIRVLKSSPNKTQAYRPRDTVAVAAIRSLIDRVGDQRGETVLRVLADAECAPIKEIGIKAVERLLFDPEFRGQVAASDLVVTVGSLRDTAERDARVFSATHGVPAWHGLAAVWFRKVKKTARPVPAAAVGSIESTSVRMHEKGHYQAPAPSTARTLRDRDSAPVKTSAKAEFRQVVELPGLPPPGRSALDQRRAAK